MVYVNVAANETIQQLYTDLIIIIIINIISFYYLNICLCLASLHNSHLFKPIMRHTSLMLYLSYTFIILYTNMCSVIHILFNWFKYCSIITQQEICRCFLSWWNSISLCVNILVLFIVCNKIRACLYKLCEL